MTAEEQKAIVEIRGTGGFRVMQSLMEQKILELDSVSSIEGKGEFSAGIQALAHKKAVKLLKDFLSEINISLPNREDKRTYE